MSTVFVTLCDEGYLPNAKKTIHELRTLGQWKGDVVLIAVEFDPEPIENVMIHKVSHIPTDKLFESYAKYPFQKGDGRHLAKTVQWDKFHVFGSYFKKWDRVVFLDASMRILNDVSPLLSLDWKGKFLAPDDTQYPPNGAQFRNVLDESNTEAYSRLLEEFSDGILSQPFFVNCIFVVDTQLLYFDELVETMNAYPISTCNEMGILNLVYTFRHKVWEPFPKKIGSKYTFGWNESPNNGTPGTWRDFLFMKYPFHTPDTIVNEPGTVFVTLSDMGYFPKAKRTIEELRGRGGWTGDVVLIAVDFEPEPIQDVIVFKTTHIATDALVEEFRKHPLKPMDDNRHFAKLYQWDKLQVFKTYFRQWDRVVFLDAGLHVLDTVQPLLDVEWKGKFVAPDDSEPNDNGVRFRVQLDLDANPNANERLFYNFPQCILDERYFLNCMFLFDTSLLKRTTFEEMECMMNEYPICMCNEMGVMNLYFTFQHRVWSPLPPRAGSKYLFGWSERNYPENPNWNAFHFMKYSFTA